MVEDGYKHLAQFEIRYRPDAKEQAIELAEQLLHLDTVLKQDDTLTSEQPIAVDQRFENGELKPDIDIQLFL
jgi:hypothetical protein